MIVRCTARLLKLLAPGALADVPPAPNDWYANLIWIDRRKCLLVVHADTLFPVFVADVRKPELANFGQYIAGPSRRPWPMRSSRRTASARSILRRSGWRALPAAACLE